MTKEEFIHELKDIIAIQTTLRWNRERLIDIEERMIKRVNKLLDIATEHYDGEVPSEKK